MQFSQALKIVLLALAICPAYAWDMPRYEASDDLSLHGAIGVNIAGKSEMRSQDTLPSFTNFTGNLSLWYGSLASFGTEFWYSALQVGLFVGYVPVMTFTDTDGRKTSDTKLPIIAELRCINKTGLFVGLGGGYAHSILRTIGITEATGPAAVISALLGWEISLPYNLQAGVVLRAMYFLQQIENVSGARTNNSQINIQPLLQIGYRF